MLLVHRILMLLCGVVIVSLMVACGGATNTTNPPADPARQGVTAQAAKAGETATLVVYRKPNSFLPDSNYEIQLNDQLAGHVRLGEHASINFFPRAGKNSLCIISKSRDGRSESSTLLFEAFPGGTYRFSCDTEIGIVRGTIVLSREDSEGVQASDVAVVLKQAPSSVEAEVENVTLAQGVKTTLKRSRVIQHSVNISRTEEDDRSLSGSLAGIEGAIRSKVESATGQSMTQTDTVERTYEFDGKEGGNYKITWVEKYREGTATVSVQGVTHTIPFKICVGADLTVQKVN